MDNQPYQFKPRRVKELMMSIFEDSTMRQQYKKEETQTTHSDIVIEQVEEDWTDRDIEKGNVSRLEIQIKKNKLKMVPLAGQVFLMMVQAVLEGRQSKQKGSLMMTNYRVVFFREGTKRVDLPFGLILSTEHTDKNSHIAYHLKYPHSWKFSIIGKPAHYLQFKNIGSIYYKSQEPKNNFAFQHALKLTSLQVCSFDVEKSYHQLKLQGHNCTIAHNTNYQLCASYPSSVIVPDVDQYVISGVAAYRKEKRFPILTYLHSNRHSDKSTPLWVGSFYDQSQPISQKLEQTFLKALRCNLPLQVYSTEEKGKGPQESGFLKKVTNHYIKGESNDELLLSQNKLVEVFLLDKQPFIRQVMNTKWYQYTFNHLQTAKTIANQMLLENAVLVRCPTGTDKSILLASLVQIILNPTFRTFQGFKELVMRVWVYGGHPFSTRLGERSQAKHRSPVFKQFLECVGQLIASNPSHFEFNFKYLALLANLMATNIYGTFLCDNYKEYESLRVVSEAVSIWDDLIEPITTNGFYDQKQGILEVPQTLGHSRVWKEYYGSLISKGTDHYQLDAQAEENEDYVNLRVQKIKLKNAKLLQVRKEKRAELERLKQLLKQRGQVTDS